MQQRNEHASRPYFTDKEASQSRADDLHWLRLESFSEGFSTISSNFTFNSMTMSTTMIAFVQTMISPKKCKHSRGFGDDCPDREIDDLRQTIKDNNLFAPANDHDKAVADFLGQDKRENQHTDESPRAKKKKKKKKKKRYDHQEPKHDMRSSTISEKLDEEVLLQLRDVQNSSDLEMVDV